MPYELGDVKTIRKRLGLTQTDLAKKADVSQSLIAKLERGLIEPTFSNAKKIFEALEEMTKQKELKAGQIMVKKVVSAKPGEELKKTISKMRKKNISQMPVMKGQNVVGFISEAILLDAMIENKGEKVREVMKDAPPIITENAGISIVSSLLRFFPMVIVAEKGKAKGVITKSDVLKRL